MVGPLLTVFSQAAQATRTLLPDGPDSDAEPIRVDMQYFARPESGFAQLGLDVQRRRCANGFSVAGCRSGQLLRKLQSLVVAPFDGHDRTVAKFSLARATCARPIDKGNPQRFFAFEQTQQNVKPVQRQAWQNELGVLWGSFFIGFLFRDSWAAGVATAVRPRWCTAAH